MKVLWIVNIILPEAIALLNGSGISDHKGSGGWMLGLADALLGTGEVELSIATVSTAVSKLTKLNGKSINYYLLPSGIGSMKRNPDYRKDWIKMRDEVNPDIVDIHGSEFSFGLEYIEACGADNVVLTMQGVMQLIAKKSRGGLTLREILCHLTFHDIWRGGIFADERKNAKRALIEKQYLSKVKYVIGRTSMDRGYTQLIYPAIRYFHCDEILRDTFYGGTWKYESCRPYSILLSTAVSPLKGAHNVMKAAGLLLKHYPDLKVNIAGRTFIKGSKFSNLFRMGGYHYYLESLIDRYGLRPNVRFLGNMSAEEMKHEMLMANIFVCPSSVENSSNSVSEAQLLGVPCASACVGGISSIVPNTMCSQLYPFDDYIQLASIIDEVFQNSQNINNSDSINMAKMRHNPEDVSKCLINIYNEIITCKCK